MSQVIRPLLQVALILSGVNAILLGFRIALQQGFGVGQWYWGGAVAVFIAPAMLALSLFLFERGTTGRALRSQDA